MLVDIYWSRTEYSTLLLARSVPPTVGEAEEDGDGGDDETHVQQHDPVEERAGSARRGRGSRRAHARATVISFEHGVR